MKKILVLLILLISVNVSATSTIVMDLDSERILYQNNAYERRLIASTTKIMTFVVAYEYGEMLLNEYVEAGEEILSMYGTSIYLNYREKMTLKDLLYGLMMRSGNDAAVVIATYIGGTEEKFVELMNRKAKEIGMHNTTFRNSHGLDEKTQNYSTAYDMALLSSYAYKIPFYREVSGTKYYDTKTLNKAYSWINRNNLLFLYKNSTGGKTGYTPSAGKTLVSTASQNDLNLTIVTLDDPAHYAHHQNLYEEYLNKYQNYVIVDKNIFNSTNEYSKKHLYLPKNITYPLTEDELANVTYNVYLSKETDYTENYIEVLLNDKVVLKKKIFLKEEKKAQTKSLWQRILDFFKK